jgi:putative transposase
MSRPPRTVFPDACYHITARGNNREDIFREDQDRGYFIKLLSQAGPRYQLRILAFCLMTNHYHLFLRTPEANLPPAMQWLNSTYAIRFNWRYQHCGHLFQGRYQSVMIQSHAHWLHLSKYLHLNPVRAGMVKDPGDYSWSSFLDYTRTRPRFSWLHPEEVLAAYGSDPGRARRYRLECLALAGKPSGFWEQYRREISAGALGGGKGSSETRGGPNAQNLSSACPRFSSLTFDPGQEISRIADAFSLQPADLLGKRQHSLARQAAYYHLFENCGLTTTQIGSRMGVSQAAVSQGAKRFRELLGNSDALKEKMRRLGSELKL